MFSALSTALGAYYVAGEQPPRAGNRHPGRALAPYNVYATADGHLSVDKETIDAINAVDESLTIASLPDQCVVRTRQMIATVKVIPFAGTLTYTGKHREPRVLDGDVPDELQHGYGFADTGAAEESNLTTTSEWTD